MPDLPESASNGQGKIATMEKYSASFLICVVIMSTVACAGPVSPDLKNSKDEPKPKDFFEDIIWETLGMTVRELLQLTQNTFSDLNSVTTAGVGELNTVMNQASPQTKEELRKIRDEVIGKIFEIVGRLLIDIGNVLPVLSGSIRSTSVPASEEGEVQPQSAADIILALLGITLENFVIAIRNALQESQELLTRTIQRFQQLEQTASPDVAQSLRRIADNYLMAGKIIVTPVLNQFQQLV